MAVLKRQHKATFKTKRNFKNEAKNFIFFLPLQTNELQKFRVLTTIETRNVHLKLHCLMECLRASVVRIEEGRRVHEVIDDAGEGCEPAAAVDRGHGSGPKAEHAAGGKAGIDGVLDVRLASVALDDAQALRRRHDGVLHVDQRLPRRHLDRVVWSDARTEEAQEGSEGSADDEAHGASEGTALKDALHHHLLARLDPGHAGRLGDDDVGVGSDLAAHEVLAHGLELGRGERDVFVSHVGH